MSDSLYQRTDLTASRLGRLQRDLSYSRLLPQDAKRPGQKSKQFPCSLCMWARWQKSHGVREGEA